MFSEATLAVQAGAKRAALLIAWAGLEATLRRAAFRAGRRGKVGTQPVVLLRELVAEGQVTAPEHRTLEHLRQLRMSAAHGLTPVAFPSDLISNIKAVSDRLLATTTLMPDRRVDWTQRATLSGTSRVGNRNLVRRTCELLNYVVVGAGMIGPHARSRRAQLHTLAGSAAGGIAGTGRRSGRDREAGDYSSIR